MKTGEVRIFPLGDSALTVEFGSSISAELNARAIALSAYFEANRFPGFLETVPAYASVSIFYDLAEVRRSFSKSITAFEAVKQLAFAAMDDLSTDITSDRRLVEIPVHFAGDDAPDLDLVARVNSLSLEKVIEIFTSTTYRVYMLGFLPGFTYMGEIDEWIATPRKDTPRETVAKGSVGIAGRQTGIYSLESPGGWQIIGRTDVEMFTPNGEVPTYLRPGDEVKFVSVK